MLLELSTNDRDDEGRSERLRHHVESLAGRIGERNMWSFNALEEAARYIETQWKTTKCALSVQTFEVLQRQVRNIILEIPGHGHPEDIVVIGAHYDSVRGSPGANDNASGIAALIELGHMLCGRELPRTLRLVAFVNEEPPFFKTPAMGSLVYATAARKKAEHIVAMVSLETIGYYTDEEGSQRFPLPPLRLIYPTRGNFVAFVANLRSRQLLNTALTAFRSREAFVAEGLVAPGWLVGVDWSDHWSFWRNDYPAIMVTDTALYRYPDYHSAQDTPDKLDYLAMAQILTGLNATVVQLCTP